VWVDIDQKLFDPAKSHEVYNTYMDLLEYADTLGFDGIGVNEHHQNGYGIMPSPNIIAAGLARRTSNAALVVLGNSIALYNPPIRVAEEFAMLDCISGGRLVAGFPVGTSMDTNYCYGQIPSLTREKYQEAHDLIIKAWTTREPFAWNGRYNKLRHVNIWPRPIQQPHPPVHIPGGGSVETYDFCIDNTYSYSYLSFSGYLRAKALMQGYWNRVEERGAPDKSPYRAGFAQTICVAETDEEAERLYSEHVSYFYNRCLHVYPGFADAPGYRTIKTIQTGALSQYAPPRGGYTQLTWKDLTEQGHVIAGSPETVRQRMEDLIKGLNVGNIFCLMHVGNMPAEKCMYSTKLFAEKVMPKLRNMFPDFADDDRFWAKPLDKRVSAGALPPAPTRAPIGADA
jgi:alkanesulfonate monooxygenase SsuD/methylene tetrahydromethanopterin reductase-like flavin-dependent oxidoreductase (luciferase family)